MLTSAKYRSAFIISFFAICLMLTLAACGQSGSTSSNSANNTGASTPGSASSSQAKTIPAKWNVALPDELSVGSQHILFKGMKVVESKDDGYILALDYEYTNDSSEGESFFNTSISNFTVYQGGVELKDTTGATSEKGVYNTNDSYTKIKDGASIDVEKIWVLRNTTDEIEIEFGFRNPIKGSITLG